MRYRNFSKRKKSAMRWFVAASKTVKKKYAVRSQAVAYPAVERERFEISGTALLFKIRPFRFYILSADGYRKIGRCIGEIIAAIFFCGIILTAHSDSNAREL